MSMLQCIIVMVVGFAIALFGMNKQKQGATWGQAVAALGAIIAIVAACWNLFGNFFGAKEKGRAREERYMYLQTKFLGDAVKKSVNPQKVCVLVDPNYYLDEWGDPLPTPKRSVYLEGIEAALKGAEIIPVYPKFKHPKPKNAANAMPPMPYSILTTSDFKKVVEEVKKAKPDIFINIFSLPMDGGANLPSCLKMLKGAGCDKAAFLNNSSNDELTFAFKDGGKSMAEVIAVVMTKVDAVYDETIPSADQKAFDRRYELVLPENYEQGIRNASGSASKK